jgi:predicted transcriptional regulator
MVAVQLDRGREELLDQLARAEGAEAADVARRVLEDYVDFRSLPKDEVADWAEASVRLTPEIISDENWGEK